MRLILVYCCACKQSQCVLYALTISTVDLGASPLTPNSIYVPREKGNKTASILIKAFVTIANFKGLGRKNGSRGSS